MEHVNAARLSGKRFCRPVASRHSISSNACLSDSVRPPPLEPRAAFTAAKDGIASPPSSLECATLSVSLPESERTGEALGRASHHPCEPQSSEAAAALSQPLRLNSMSYLAFAPSSQPRQSKPSSPSRSAKTCGSTAPLADFSTNLHFPHPAASHP